MRQQEANQFDKGLNLDTNPIAMDNHQLTGALNATMITMNGNELVLLNDMGNGKVDQALLPEGYVPVGMKEYGGIVYVASYNPIKGESLIGCFPSPQRNIPSDDTDSAEPLGELSSFVDNGYIDLTSKLIVLINDTLRAGDKFIIISNNFSNIDSAIANNLIKVSVLVVDEQGNGIDITNDLIDYNLNSTYTYTNFKKILKTTNGLSSSQQANCLNIYKNTIPGKLSIKEELILPDYINVGVKSLYNAQTEKYTVTFTPRAYKFIDGNEVVWNSDGTDNDISGFHFALVNNGVELSPITPTMVGSDYTFVVSNVSEDTILTYVCYPEYTYGGTTGKVKKLKKSGAVDVKSIGSGKVTFDGTFKYYNDIVKDRIILDYSTLAYIEGNDDYSISDIYIEAYDIEDLFNSNGTFKLGALTTNLPSNKIKIQLSKSNYFGSYSTSSLYKPGTSHFNKGFYYIGRLCVDVAKVNGNSFSIIPNKGPWYAIITSALTNDVYLNDDRDMFPILGVNSPEEFNLSWEADVSREEMTTNSPQLTYDTNPSGLSSNIISNVNTNNPDNFRVKYHTTKSGRLKYKYTVNSEVKSPNKFPYDISFTPRLKIDGITYSRQITYDGEPQIGGDELLTNATNVALNYTTSEPFYYGLNDYNTPTIYYNITSLLFAKLRINENSSETGLGAYRFSVQAPTDCIIPYTPRYYNADNINILRSIIGSSTSIKTMNSSGTLDAEGAYVENHIMRVEMSKKFRYMIIDGDWHSGWDWDPTMNKADKASLWSKYWSTNLSFGGEKFAGLSDDRNSDSDLTSLSSIGTGIASKNNNEKPLFVLWYGDNSDSKISTLQSNANEGSNSYCIVMIRNEDGTYYPLNQWRYTGANYIDIATEIVRDFSTIYLCQPNQSAFVDYYTLSTTPDEYVFTNLYNVDFKTTVSVSSYNEINQIQTPIKMDLKLSGSSTNSNFNSHNKSDNLYITDTVSGTTNTYYFPKFVLINGSKTIEFEDLVSSPNQSVVNTKLLDETTPTLGTVAIVNDLNGNTVITSAYKFIGSNKQPVNIDPTHTYLLCGYQSGNNITETPGVNGSKNAILLDINASNEAGISSMENLGVGKYGVLIALAIKKGRFKKVPDIFDGYNGLVLNVGACPPLIGDSQCIYWLGYSKYSSNLERNVSWRKKVSTAARYSIVDLQLFPSPTQLIKNFLS